MIETLNDKTAIEAARYIFGNDEIYQKESEIHQKESEIYQKESEIYQKESEICQKESEIFQKKSEISPKKSEIYQKRSEISQKESEIYQKESEISQKRSEISQKKSEIYQIIERKYVFTVPDERTIDIKSDDPNMVYCFVFGRREVWKYDGVCCPNADTVEKLEWR